MFLLVFVFAAGNDGGHGRHGAVGCGVLGFRSVFLGLLSHFFFALVTFSHMASIVNPDMGFDSAILRQKWTARWGSIPSHGTRHDTQLVMARNRSSR